MLIADGCGNLGPVWGAGVLGCRQYARCGNKQYVGTPLLFCVTRCILGVAGWEMDWKTPVTQQLFVSQEGRGVVTFMLMTYCLLASCVISHHACVCVCVCVAYVWSGSSWFQVFLSTMRFIWIRNVNAQNPWDVWRSGYLASYPSHDTMLYLRTLVKRQESDDKLSTHNLPRSNVLPARTMKTGDAVEAVEITRFQGSELRWVDCWSVL